jgi:hypothetical protein
MSKEKLKCQGDEMSKWNTNVSRTPNVKGELLKCPGRNLKFQEAKCQNPEPGKCLKKEQMSSRTPVISQENLNVKENLMSRKN